MNFNLKRLSAAQLWFFTIIISIVLAELIAGGMELLLKGAITYDYLLTGFVASFFVAGLVAGILAFFISQLKKNEALLRASQERLEIATDSGHTGIWEYNIVTNELIWDDTMFALYGARREDFSGAYEAWATRLHPDDRAATEAALQDCINGIREYEPDFRIIWPNGEVHYIKGHARTVRDETGKALRIVGTNWDNRAYAFSQQQLQWAYTAINSSKTAFFWISPEGKVRDVNEYACQHLGYSREELLAMNLWDFDPNYSPAVRKASWERTKQKKIQTFESLHRRKDGKIFPVEITANYIVFNGEESSFAIAHDITERKQAEIAIRESEAHLARAQAQAQLGSWTIDFATNMFEWSDEAYRIFGIPIGTPVSYATFLSLVHPDDRESVDQAWEAALRGEKYDLQHRIIVAGEIKWIRKLIELEFSADNSAVHGIGTCQDITLLKEIQVNLEESHAKLRSLAIRMKLDQEQERKMVARELHEELGQILTALRMDISLMRMNFVGDNPQLSERIRQTVGLVDKTIQVTRNVATSLRPPVLDMGGIRAALEWLAASFTEQSGIPCDLNFSEQEFDLDEAKSIVIFRIVQESLTNIARYANASELQISLEYGAEECVLVIADNGQGFDLAESRNHESYGLLEIHELARGLGGKVSITSKAGQGTMIIVRIPLV